ncbi:hypothetical protein M9H77_11714 [Catharanthus roseus]|uniref:Uncharacterized protein n=1 Tax=Catharanthus roseus TaxID=4058 RepID=A0ACC0BFE2_CATRO|nr:hypothetical protein M9H77_11714 [Catharanthus roseus]
MGILKLQCKASRPNTVEVGSPRVLIFSRMARLLSSTRLLPRGLPRLVGLPIVDGSLLLGHCFALFSVVFAPFQAISFILRCTSFGSTIDGMSSHIICGRVLPTKLFKTSGLIADNRDSLLSPVRLYPALLVIHGPTVNGRLAYLMQNALEGEDEDQRTTETFVISMVPEREQKEARVEYIEGSKPQVRKEEDLPLVVGSPYH